MMGVVVLWSFTPTLVKIALRTFDPLTITFLRLAQGVTVMFALYKLRGGKLRRLFIPDGWILLGGAGVTINYIFFVYGFNFTTAGAGGLVMQVQLIALLVLATVVLREPISAKKLAGICAVVAGVSLVFITGGELGGAFRAKYLLGNAMLVLAGIGWAIYAVCNKALAARRPVLEILLPVLGMALVASAVAALFRFELRAPLTLQAVLTMIALGALCTGVSFILISEGLKRLSASLAGVITSLTPIANLLLAHWLLGEQLYAATLVSGILVIGGIVAIALAEPK